MVPRWHTVCQEERTTQKSRARPRSGRLWPRGGAMPRGDEWVAAAKDDQPRCCHPLGAAGPVSAVRHGSGDNTGTTIVTFSGFSRDENKTAAIQLKLNEMGASMQGCTSGDRSRDYRRRNCKSQGKLSTAGGLARRLESPVASIESRIAHAAKTTVRTNLDSDERFERGSLAGGTAAGFTVDRPRK